MYDDESSGSSEPLHPDGSSSSGSEDSSASQTETSSRTSIQSSENGEYANRKIEKLHYLKLKLRAKLKKRGEARERGATLASKTRDLDFCQMLLGKNAAHIHRMRV